MTWLCPRCQNELGELNGWCEYCKQSDNILVYNPDKYYVRDIRIYHICGERSEPMTPQEQLFATLFNHEKVLVKDMDTLSLRAHREELAKIAFEARARLSAVDDEEKSRKKTADGKGATGFARSVNIDDASSQAINTIKERQKRQTKQEKLLAGLKALGIDNAESLLKAGTILNQVQKQGDKKSEDIMKNNVTRSPLSGSEGFVIQKSKEEIEKQPSKPFNNPFEKK